MRPFDSGGQRRYPYVAAACDTFLYVAGPDLRASHTTYGTIAKGPELYNGGVPSPSPCMRRFSAEIERLREGGSESVSIPFPPSSLLIWLAGALGDTLLAYPALAAWRAHAPGCRITAVGRSSFGPAQRAGLLDRVVDVDGPLASGLFAGRGQAHLAPPDAALVWSAAPDSIVAGLRAWGAGRIHAYPPRGPAGRHQAEYLLAGFAPLGLPAILPPLPLLRVEPSVGYAEPLGASTPGVLLHPGAGGRWKRWDLGRFLELGAALGDLGYPVRWSCGPADDDLRASLHAAGAGHALWPYLDLPAYADALGRCPLLVSPDTGVAHLAALLGVPQVTLFGPTDPARWRPLGPLAAVLLAPDRCGRRWEALDGAWPLPVRRCPADIGDRCACLEALDMEVVLRTCLERLS